MGNAVRPISRFPAPTGKRWQAVFHPVMIDHREGDEGTSPRMKRQAAGRRVQGRDPAGISGPEAG